MRVWGSYLVLEVAFVEDGGVVRLLEFGELLLEQLALVTGAAVLEPDGDLLGIEPELGGQVHLPAGFQLSLLPETQLQHPHLLVAQPPLLGIPRVDLAAAVGGAAPRSPPPPAPRSRSLVRMRRGCIAQENHRSHARPDTGTTICTRREEHKHKQHASARDDAQTARVRTIRRQEGGVHVHEGVREQLVVLLVVLLHVLCLLSSLSLLAKCEAEKREKGNRGGNGVGVLWCVMDVRAHRRNWIRRGRTTMQGTHMGGC
jgi:hypothetical protein